MWKINADETAIFFTKKVPNKTLTLKNEKSSDGKYSKEQLTLLLPVTWLV